MALIYRSSRKAQLAAMRTIIGLATLALPACTASAPPDDLGEAERAARDAEVAQTTPRPPQTAPQDREPTDLAPCPGINPDIRRPAGSNCLGILPAQCGADRAQAYVGRKGTPELREELRALAVDKTNGNFRWIPYNTPVIEDLRANRFNVELDRKGVITKVDCY